MAEETQVTATPVPPAQPPAAPPASEPKPNLEATQQDQTISALNKLFDETPAPQPAVTTVTETKEPEKQPTPIGTEEFQKSLDAIRPPEGAHPNVGRGIDELKRLAQESEKRANEYQAKLQEYEKKVTDYEAKSKEPPKLPEDIEKELTNLRSVMREMDYRNSGEFQKEYMQPVVKAEQDIQALFQQAGLDDKMLKWIQDNGGIINMAQSSEPIDDKQTMADYIEQTLLANTPEVFRRRIIGKISAAHDIIDKANRELEDWHQNSSQRYEARMKKMSEDFKAGRDGVIASLGDLAKSKTIPSDATAEQRLAIEAHNTRLRDAEAKFNQYVNSPYDARMAGEVTAKAAQADVIKGMYDEAQAQIKSLQEQLDSQKAAGSHSLAGMSSPPIGPSKPTSSDLLKTSTEKAMEELFRRANV